jgi:hypothetical protein
MGGIVQQPISIESLKAIFRYLSTSFESTGRFSAQTSSEPFCEQQTTRFTSLLAENPISALAKSIRE